MDISPNAPIGVFDSGVGGLTVMREIRRNLPNENIIYFGDTARVPYGSKSKNVIIRYTRQIIRFLTSMNVKALVVACNTASSLALEVVRQETQLPIIGVVRPGARVAAATTENGRIGVIGTEATTSSNIYKTLINEINPDIIVFQQSCPLFCPLVEEGWLKDPVTDEIARRYLSNLESKNIDTLILGCTHYPLIRSTIGRLIGPAVRLVNPAYETALELGRLLSRLKLNNTEQPEDIQYKFYVSDAPESFARFAVSCSFEAIHIEQINIENY